MPLGKLIFSKNLLYLHYGDKGLIFKLRGKKNGSYSKKVENINLNTFILHLESVEEAIYNFYGEEKHFVTKVKSVKDLKHPLHQLSPHFFINFMTI